MLDFVYVKSYLYIKKNFLYKVTSILYIRQVYISILAIEIEKIAILMLDICEDYFELDV